MKYQRIVVISLVLLGLVGLMACGPASLVEPLEDSPPQSEAVPIGKDGNVAQSDSELFAANPELMAARRHLIEPKRGALTDSQFYAANPELMVADRYRDAVNNEANSASTFYAANPELMTAHRYAAAE